MRLARLGIVTVVCFVSACADARGRSSSSTTTVVAGGTCHQGAATELPTWAADYSGLVGEKVVSANGDVVGVVFADTLRHAAGKTEATNKILWVVRQPRNGKPLVISATLDGSDEIATIEQDAGPGPGEIYPTDMNLPLAGCWHMVLAWDGNTDTIDLEYR